MTYSEVLTRLVELLYVNAEKQAVLTAAAAACGQELPYPSPPSGSGRWLHPTFCSRVQSFALRAEERFRGAGPGDPVPAPAPPVVSPEAIAAKPAQALLEVSIARVEEWALEGSRRGYWALEGSRRGYWASEKRRRGHWVLEGSRRGYWAF